jgi:hypothetical protein
LPPVRISTFDPNLMTYITKATAGIPIKVVAVSPFDPAQIDYVAPTSARLGRSVMVWASVAALVAVLLLTTVFVIRFRRRRSRSQQGERAARRFAGQMERELNDCPLSSRLLARKILEGLISYAQIGAGRAPGAITPDEARQVIEHLTGAEELAGQADRLVMLCDRELFAQMPERDDAHELLDQARGLFKALGHIQMRAGDPD